MAIAKLISADSHVSEPVDLWANGVDKKYRDRAPRLVENPKDPNGAYFYYDQSFHAPAGPHTIAISRYGAEITAVVADGPTWGVQFHPEKSQATGLALLTNALNALERVA